jgi:hypothetical protein
MASILFLRFSIKKYIGVGVDANLCDEVQQVLPTPMGQTNVLD